MRNPLLAPIAVALAALSADCTCGSHATTAPAAAADGQAPTASASASVAATVVGAAAAAVFSAPIAAVRLADGSTVVAGLVAAESVVRASRVRADGSTSWTVDALRGVAWAADAELKAMPAADGAALVWRGPRDGKSGRTLVVLGPAGETRAEPAVVGAALCATSDGIAWTESSAGGAARVRARRWADAAPRDVVAVAADRDPSLVCGDHAVFVLGDGDDDLTATSFVPGDAAGQPPVVAVRDADFGDDEEREHDAYTLGDDLALVRIGSSGAVATRDLPRAGQPSAWRKQKHALSGDDDVVAVDGDAAATLVVFTHDADDACPGLGSSAESVRALRIDRKTGEDTLVDLAPADCDRSRGPFWIAAAKGAPVVAWVERATKLPAKAAPIVALALRGVQDAGRKIEVSADALVDAGCTASGCAAAALLRSPDGDVMRPGSIRVLAYP